MEKVQDPEFVASMWKKRFGNLAGQVCRLAREVQALGIHERVKRKELTYAQGERLAMFLDLERLGLAQSYYPLSVYRQRKREAGQLGYAPNDGQVEPLEVDLAELLVPYITAVEAEPPGGGS